MGRMSGLSGNWRLSRSGMVALIMSGVLLSSVGAAWLVVQRRGISPGRGKEIVGRIRKEGLSAYWPGVKLEWFLRQSQGQVIGWRASIGFPRGDGWFDGMEVGVRPVQQNLLAGEWERWSLNENAAEGSYSAGSLVANALQLVSTKVDTRIKLEKGQVFLQQQAAQQVLASRSATPDDYLPEGMMAPARLMLARERTKANFTLIFNELAPTGDRVNFGTVTMVSVNLDEELVRGAKWAVTAYFAQSRRSAETCFLDASGKVLAVIHHNMNTEDATATQEEVTAAFPHAADLLRQLMVQVRLRPPRQTAPASQERQKEGEGDEGVARF